MKNKIKILLRRFWKLILGSLILFTAILLLCNFWVKKEAKGWTFDSVEAIPFNHTGLVLGTSKKLKGGKQNLYFKNRMEAAYQLFKSGKINFIIVSGDNSEFYYNETRDMKKSLVELGIPEDSIVEDFAGFSTLDSVLRAKEVFGQDSITVISQQFHNERAIFIGKNHDIYALGFNAEKVPKGYGTMTLTREYFARVKAILDIYVFHTMPKFYKEKESFPNNES